MNDARRTHQYHNDLPTPFNKREEQQDISFHLDEANACDTTAHQDHTDAAYVRGECTTGQDVIRAPNFTQLSWSWALRSLL